ncbi:site-specific DNA-methyltransferase [Anaerolineales bacterium HSG24]|nr:site-specific DNA-methyltransferase [Anaerolineales bacterium HSG24]
MTQTSSFGVSKREKHDSSLFYNRNLYYKFFHKSATKEELNIEVPEPSEWVDQIYDHASTKMEIIPANSVALALASPSYNITDIDEYLHLIRKVGKEVYRVLRPGGRYVINIANLGSEPYVPLHSFFYQLHAENLGFLPMGEIIWRKNEASRDRHEYIVVFAKQDYSRPDKGKSSIERDEFMAATLSIWNPAQKKETVSVLSSQQIISRIIELYSYVNDVILDPFMTNKFKVCDMAQTLNRYYVGFTNFPSIEREESELSNDFLYKPSIKEVINPTSFKSDSWADKIYNDSSTDMKQLPDNSVALAFTSPPYNVGKDYDDDMGFDEYLDLIREVGQEVYRVLKPGGKYVINIANLGRKPYIPLHSFFYQLHIEKLGFLPKEEIIWQKGVGANSSCAWGSWMSAKSPRLRDIHEYLLVFEKQEYSRPSKNGLFIGNEEISSIWKITPESARKIGHPAPFPVKLAGKVIELYSYKNDVVLDPFMGSGTTNVAAKGLNRRHVGYDISSEYCELAEQRIKQMVKGSLLSQAETS